MRNMILYWLLRHWLVESWPPQSERSKRYGFKLWHWFSPYAELYGEWSFTPVPQQSTSPDKGSGEKI